MAAEGEVQQEIVTHERGYAKFIGLMKWGAIISLVTALVVILLIAE